MRKMYKEDERIAEAKEKAQEATLAKEKLINAERQKAITLEQAKAKYVSQGYGKTDSTRLARLEVSGADVATLNSYKAAIEATTRATGALNPVVEKATTSHSNFLGQIKGIAIYAALSAAIYGVMTAMTSLAVSTVKMADEYTAIQNRMKLYITDAKELGKVNNQLAQFSMQNNVGLRETASLFSRLAPSMQKIGANTAAITSVVDAFGKSMRIGGATAMEAASATVQFSQAMASGKLAGDEFRSISEASPRFLQAIAEGSGIAAEKLKEMSAAGMLTTEVISKALLKEYPKLIEENKKLGITLEQGANAIKTGFLVAIGEFNEGAKITEALGESMLDLAQSMFTFAQTARESGAEVKKWFEDNADAIQTVVEAVKLLAITLVSKYVASMVVAAAISLKTAYSLHVAAIGATAAQRAFGLATIATIRLGSVLSALATPKNLFTLGLTVAAVAASYLLMKDSAAEANVKLVEQSKLVTKTKEELAALNEEQRKNALLEVSLNVNEANDNLEKLSKQYKSSVLDMIATPLRVDFIKDVRALQEQVDAGTLSFDSMTRKLVEMGAIGDKEAQRLIKQTIEYNEAAKAAKTLADTQALLGVKTRLMGNDAQNATPAVQGMKNAVTGLGDEASITGLKVQAFGKSMQDLVGTYTNLLRLRKATGLNESFGTKALEEGQSQAAKNESIVKANKAVALAQEAIIRDKRKGLDVSKEQLYLDKVRESLSKKQESLAFSIAQQVAPLAKAAQDAQEANSEYTSSLKKQGKEQEKVSKEADKVVDKYESQEAVALRLAQYLRQGVVYSVAKKASEEKYAKVYGSNLDVAKKIVKAEKELADLESKSKSREDAKEGLTNQLRSYQKIIGFMREGFNYSVAQKTVQDGFVANAEGIIHANENLLSTLQEKALVTTDEIRNQQDLLAFVKGGLSVEEASAKVAIYRNKHLNDAVRIASEFLSKQEKELLYRKALLSLEVDLNSQKQQASNLVSSGSNELASIMSQYKGIGVEEAKSYQTQQRIVNKLTEYNDLLERQKSMTEAISNINFDVFGDFGNPFKSALEGLNTLMFGMDDVSSKYQQMFSAIDTNISKHKEGTEEHTNLIKQKANLELLYIDEKEKAQNAAITAGLSLTKSMFKQESKGYKIVSGLEKAYQASKIAFALWEKKDTIAMLALSLKAHITDMLGFTTGAAAKVAAQQGVNVAKGTEIIMNQGSGDPYTAFARMAAMAAAVAALGVAIGSFSGSSGGSYVDTSNQGTGTVFGDSEAQSASIANSIDLLSENSDLILPLTSAMLRSLRNIESSMGGVTNLILRGGIGQGFNVQEGKQKSFGGLLSTKTTVKASGLYGGSQKLGDILSEGFNLQEYIDIQTKKKVAGITTSNKSSTKYSKANDELSNQFTLIFKGFYDTILSATDILGADMSAVQTNLENAVVSIGKINLKGLSGEEIQEKLEAVFGAAADDLAKQAFGGLEDFQSVGEGYYETLVKVASAVEEAAYYTDRLNVTAINYTNIVNKQADDLATEIVRQSYLTKVGISTIKGGMTDLVNTFDGSAEEITDFINTLEDLQEQMFMTGKNADYLTSSMIIGAGGLDSLASGFDAYFEMLSPAEQAAELTRRLTNEFAIFGKALPADVKAFRNLVSSIDITTEAGQKLYGQIIALAPEFNDLQDALDSANSEVNALVQSLRDLAEQARAARGETEQPRNLAYTRSQFEQASVLAMQGDTASAEKLLTLGKDLMGLSKTYSVTGSEYARDLALIQRAATVSADIQEQGLGTSISTTLTPSTGTGTTTPTVNTTNSTMTTELKGMREELNAGLFAIAKFVQNVDSRTERWDDGGRMMVGIQPENGDIPVPVTVVP